MENNIFDRTERLLGEDNMQLLKNSVVAVFGIGGVGSYAAEALVRSGIENIILIDYDKIDITNINRQVHALHTTVGRDKVEVMKDRLLDINPDLNIKIHNEKYNKDTRDNFDFDSYDYVVDAIDMISSKLDLIETCYNKDIKIISAMGAGNKLNPTMLEVGDISKTQYCPLARVMRRELKKRGIDHLKVVWSREKAAKVSIEKENARKSLPASIAFVPSVVGLIIASEIVKDICVLEV